MCGIAGVFGINGQAVNRHEVRDMCDAILHRGPDDEGYYINENIGLGMRRLSIIDVDHGHQPVWNESNNVCVVLNGEIYNYAALRKSLLDRGHEFYTSTDTEVIVHLYEEYGEECVQHLRGMFAFAIWDGPQKKLMLARDRLGIKPLFFGEVAGRLVFASELKALLTLPELKRDLNWGSVSHLFSFLSSPREESIIQGIHKLEPGYLLTVTSGQSPRVRCYWDVNFEPNQGRSEQDTIEELRELLDESVRLCMVSDVPVGAFLSGGIDSSAVVAMMARHSSRPVKTFSIGFAERVFDESAHASLIARTFATDHHEIVLDPDVSGIMDDLAWYLDEPFGDSSAIPTYMVSRLASRQVKVVLSGDGGDEIFAGYDKYLVEQRERRYRFLPAPLRKIAGLVGGALPEGAKGRNFLRHLGLHGADRYLHASTMFGQDEKTALFQDGVAEQILAQDPWRQLRTSLGLGVTDGAADDSGRWLSRIQYLDIKNYLPLDILTKVDRMSMAHSIEARVPLLDHKLVEFAATIPPALKLKDGSTKHIFKQAMRGILPDSTIDRRKQGFAVPLGRWFRGELDGYVRDLLLSEKSRARGIFNPQYIEKLLKLHRQGRSLDLQLWTLMSFELWCRIFLDGSRIYKPRVRSPSAVTQVSFKPVKL